MNDFEVMPIGTKDKIERLEARVAELEAHVVACSDTCGFQARRIAELEGALREIVKRQDPMGGEAYIAKQALKDKT